MTEEQPQKFGNYTLHKLIARGGMAEIYRATMPGIGGFEKTVAIKKILPHLAENEEFITMLKDEANILVSISHSNIAQVYDLGKIEDTYYISMEYVHGIDLSHVIKSLHKRSEYLPIEHAVYIGSCMCAGLHAAHTNTDKQGNPLNIVHRDVSPHNVIISYAGDVKLIDFGVAKAAVKESHTQMGVIKGKLLYMAPEQAMAKDLDGRADLFAVGLCMYKMLTHELPFRGENEFQIYNNILSKEITPPKQLNPQVPEEVNQIVMTLLQRDPDKRYQDGYSAKQDLERALHNVAPGYTVNRLSRFIEDNFSKAAQQQQQNAQDISGPSGVAPQTPSANSVGTGQLQSGDDIPELELEPEGFDNANSGRERVPAGGQPNANSFGAEPPPQPPSAGPQGNFRTQTNSEKSTGQLNAKQLAQGAEADKKSGPPTAVYAIGLLLLVIVGLVVYGIMFAETSTTTEQPAETANAPAPSAEESAPSPTVRVSLDSEPTGAKIVRGEDTLGTTPHELTLMRSDEPITLVLRKEGFAETVFQIIPDSNLDQTIELEPGEGEEAGEPSAELNFEVEEGDGEEAAVEDDAPRDDVQRDTPEPKEEPQEAPAPPKEEKSESTSASKTTQKPAPAKPEPKPEPKQMPVDDGASGQAPPPADDAPSLFDDEPSEPASAPKPKEQGGGGESEEKSDDIIDPFG
ncbi:serine/threonine protein kinase [Persicimonas caeni]|uniref:Serine/threonine protein kinase n=1 Tax=Persicimonas caeni TaxID=2292766 RepID=A0A4Y6PPJ9_PERCE|nr:serine/threonine-protein kinase [Persicimonas caeni]QDG49695.1 serine/threonine protein kinase [Persicimonas caeni]QED30916.1 serine/threonine protein kinase [Persicimonas caeni]